MSRKTGYPLVTFLVVGVGLYWSCLHLQADSFLIDEKTVSSEKPTPIDGTLFLPPSHNTGIKTKTSETTAGSQDTMPPPGIALNTAVAMNDLETVTEMITGGVDVNRRTEDSLAQTALMAVTSSRMAALLLKAGADPRLADAHGTTVLHHTVLKEAALSLIPPLVAAGADVNAVEPAGGETPFLWAKQWFFGIDPEMGFKVLDLLLRKGANINTKDNTGNTLLHIAVMNRKPQLARFLVDKGADASLANEDGRTPRETARDLNYPEMGALLGGGGN